MRILQMGRKLLEEKHKKPTTTTWEKGRDAMRSTNIKYTSIEISIDRIETFYRFV